MARKKRVPLPPFVERDVVEVDGEPGVVTDLYYDTIEGYWVMDVEMPAMEDDERGRPTSYTLQLFSEDGESWDDGTLDDGDYQARDVRHRDDVELMGQQSEWIDVPASNRNPTKKLKNRLMR